MDHNCDYLLYAETTRRQAIYFGLPETTSCQEIADLQREEIECEALGIALQLPGHPSYEEIGSAFCERIASKSVEATAELKMLRSVSMEQLGRCLAAAIEL